MKNHFITICSLLCFLAASSYGYSSLNNHIVQECHAEPVDTVPMHQVFLLGGTANEPFFDSPLPDFLASQLKNADKNSSIIFLGNIIEGGLPFQSYTKRHRTNLNFFAIEKMLQDYKGEIIFLPGYEDWENGSKSGRAVLERQQKFIEERLSGKNVKTPCHRCPGPKAIKLNKDIILITMDTQWWLQQKGRNEGSKECSINIEEEFLLELQVLLEEYDDKEIIIAGHHALYSAGPHAGFFPAKYHFFPLTEANRDLWLPLPVIGSIYPIYRSVIGPNQDHANIRYTYMKEQLEDILEQYPNLIYASGNEESLQYFNENKKQQHYIISGSASNTDYVAKSTSAEFAESGIGFFKINYYQNGSVWLEAWSFPKMSSQEAVPVFRKELKPSLSKKFELIPELMPRDSIVQIGDSRYSRDDFVSKSLIGKNYRKEWQTPLKVPVIDFAKEEFTPVKLGGGVQTKSLRVERPDGTQFVLRGVQKDVTQKLPRFLRKTFVKTWMQDAISSTHPYAALPVPTLAREAGINHAIPRLGYVPSSKELGRFNHNFAGTFVQWEGRPKGDMSAFANFGHAKDIESTSDVLQKTRKSPKNRVDEPSLIRNRLFDVLIGDIDRHDDQWRWAVYEQEDGGEIYHPIPRDRDFAFVKGDGALLKIAGLKWAFRPAQSFREDIRDLAGLTMSGKYLDRTFITESTRNDWKSIGEDLQQKLNDQVIEQAIHQWPDPIYKLNGTEITEILKKRRGQLPVWAEELYEIYAGQVDVLGSNKRDFFEITHLEDDMTRVKVYHLNKEGEKKKLYYQRDFFLDETKEISLYGFRQDDIFEFRGQANKGILIRAIGGNGADIFDDQSHIKKGGKKNLIYDTKKNTNIINGQETKDLTSNREFINFYDRFEHKYPKPLPLIVLGFNRDDIFYLGGGYQFRTFGFRKKPYATKQAAKLYFSLSKAFAVSYSGDFKHIAGPLNLEINTHFLGPNYKSRYFGAGNESQVINSEDPDFHAGHYDEFQIAPNLYIDSKYHKHKVNFGPVFQHVDVRQGDKDNFISSSDSGIPQGEFLAANYLGIRLGYLFQSLDKENAPTRGIRWENIIRHQKSLEETNYQFTRYSSTLSLYIPLHIFRSVLATRTGIATSTGDYAFYQSNFIGGQRTLLANVTLSGYQRNRFAGKTAFYQNFEYRTGLFENVKIILPFDIGLVANFDLGRVWEPEEDSSILHKGYGLGITGTIAHFPVFALNYTWSKEDRFIIFSTKMRF